MFGSQLDEVRAKFAQQFEPEGDGFVYRKALTGAPIRISAAEHDAFLAEFDRDVRRLTWSMVGGSLVLITIYVTLAVTLPNGLPDVWMWLAILLPIAPFMIGWMRAWYAPARALSDRTTAGPARSRQEVRRKLLTEMSWSRLAFAGAAISLAVWQLGGGMALLHGWRRLWLALWAAGIVILAMAAIRKARLGRE